MCTPYLPAELWTHVFRYLSLSDRLSVRASCKYFMERVDSSDLWKKWILKLTNSVEYEEDFWCMLRRWRVTSARLSSLISWTQIIRELPGLTMLFISSRWIKEMLNFQSFTNLERLYITAIQNPIDLEKFSLLLPPRLTHLTLCHEMYESNTLPTEISPDSPLKKLKSFAFHSLYNLHPVKVLHFFLSSLPQLQHLSLSAYSDSPYEGKISDLPPLKNSSLCSLDLERCEANEFPVDLMKMLKTLPFLRKLAILCSYCTVEQEEDSSNLSTWLKDLPALTSLVVMGRNVSGFISSIPRGLTRLTLLPTQISPEDIAALATQLPNLCHLHLQPMMSFLGSDIVLIPQYFPKLKSLCILFELGYTSQSPPCEQIPDDAFLSLASLKELEVLQVQGYELPPAALVAKFRELTNNRVRIYCRSEEDRLRSCDCTFNISSDSWT